MVFQKSVKIFSAIVLIGLFLSACEQASIVNETVMQDEENLETVLDSISPDSNQRSPLQVDGRPWYGNKAVSMQGDKSLPRQFTSANAITMTFAQPVTFLQATQMVEGVSGIPVQISNNVYSESINKFATREFMPSGGQEVSGGRLVWSGGLHTLLNQMAGYFGAEWEYENGAIRFVTENTKTFMLNAMAGEMTLTGSASSTGDSSASSNVPEIDLDGNTTLEIWNEISETIDSIVGSQGNAVYSPSTGAITVTASPNVLRRVENYLRYQNQMRLRRIAVSVQVLSVQTEDTQTYGLDVAGVIRAALGNTITATGSQNTSNGLNLSIFKNPTGANTSGDLTATLEANEGIERASIVHSGTLVTLSDQPAPLQVARQIAFLERVTGSDTSVSLEPGTVDVGLFMTVLPRIVEGDKILMRLSIAITDADPNFRQFGTDEVQIELPELETTGFLQNAVLGNGETMVLAGFEKRSSSLNESTNPFSALFGGRSNASRGRELLVLVLNSRILPEQPLTVIGQ